MADEGHKLTDKKIAEMEERLAKEYSQAEREVKEKLEDYFRRFETKDNKWQQWVKNGEKTEKEYKAWRTQQMAQGERWAALKEQLAEDYSNTNQIARGIIDGYMPDIYALNHNFGLYQIESGGNLETSLTLYNRNTVERLMRDDPELLPPPGKKVSDEIAKGKAERWSRQKMQSIMTQGIMQGESIPHLATRLATEVGETNRKAAVRNARTMATNAQNAGRYDSYRDARDTGIDLTIEWSATLDGRTRYDHRMLHGVRREVDEPFEVDGIEILYPAQLRSGDSDIPQEMIWNCRCTLLAWVKGFEGETVKHSDKMGDMSFEEWQQGKAESQDILAQEQTGEAIAESYIREYEDHEIIEASSQPIDQTTQYNEAIQEAYDTRYGQGDVEYRQILEELPVGTQLDNCTGTIYTKTEDGKWSYDPFGDGTKVFTQSTNAMVNEMTGKPIAPKVMDPEGVDLYKHFIEGGSADIHSMAGYKPYGGGYDPDKVGVDEESLAKLDTVFHPAEKEMVVYKGSSIMEGDEQVDREVNHTLASTSYDKQVAVDYAERVFDYESDAIPLVQRITIEEGVPIADARTVLDAEGMRAYEKELTVGRETVWEYSELVEKEYPDGEIYYEQEVVVRAAEAKDEEIQSDLEEEKAELQQNTSQEYQEVAEDAHVVAEGEDITDTWTRRPDEFDFEIEDIMSAQGFDGLPRVVSAEEFDEAVKAANGGNGFIAQRTYSAPDQETLDAYRDQLYNGKWYVDCSTGGAQYGQGMYCAADYTGELTQGIKNEMQHYQELNRERGSDFAHTETITLDSSAKIIEYDDLIRLKQEHSSYIAKSDLDEFIKGSSIPPDIIEASWRFYNGETIDGDLHKIMDYAGKHHEEFTEMDSYISALKAKATMIVTMDDGAFATMKGYDAINASGHGESGSYTVILNRTKLIILGEQL